MENEKSNLGKDEVRRNLINELADTHYVLSPVEKQFLLCAERGDCASLESILESHHGKSENFSINCMDPLNRTSLIVAIEKENIDLMELLLKSGIEVKDALLHAIDEEYVEGVELLLQWEEKCHEEGRPYSWEIVDNSASTFTVDITPVILAAHKNNYEILKLLMDRGATLPVVHDIRCACDNCLESSQRDSLRHSQSRMNVYKALASPSLICLTSRDPLLTAFELYWELKSLSNLETEFRTEYNEMKEKVQTFASTLLDHLRTSNELEIILNYNPVGTPWEPGDEPTFDRLKLAIKYKLKLFVAHPTIQQILGSIWYKGLPGFRGKTMLQQGVDVALIGMMFFVYSIMYIINPNSEKGRFMKLPFIKFICHSASYGVFLGLLSLASQRIELILLKIAGMHIGWAKIMAEEIVFKERGALPGFIEFCIILYIISLVLQELKSLYNDGLMEYLEDLWNIVDFFAFTSYITWILLKLTAWFIVRQELHRGHNPWYPRHKWATFEPNLVSESAFTAGMIISFLKLVHIFSINPHLGPLQISLGRMIIDIIKFFFIYTLVLFAYGCGLTQLLWYFAGLEEDKCYPNDSSVPDFDNQDKACTIWRRFVNLFEASQSLFWASFGLVDLTAFDLTGVKSFTRFWALLIFGSYSVMNIIVLLNMLIAMMSNSYQIISERADSEWKYARSKLFLSYFESGNTVPPPFNLCPTLKHVSKITKKEKVTGSIMRKKEAAREKADLRYEIIMQMLIRRYITFEQKKMEEFGVTEDDIAEVRHDISTMRFELLDIFRKNGYKVPKSASDDQMSALARKDKIMERRILKDFQIGVVEGIVKEAIISDKTTDNIFSKIAKAIKRTESEKKDWNTIVQKSFKEGNPIGKSSIKQQRLTQRRRSQSLSRYIMEHQDSQTDDLDPDKLVEYNPNLSELNAATRIAYAKFKLGLLKKDHRAGKQSTTEDETTTSITEAEDGIAPLGPRASTSGSATESVDHAVVVKQIDETKQKSITSSDTSSSIVRPRPQSSLRKLPSMPGRLPASIAEESSETVEDDKRERLSMKRKQSEISKKATADKADAGSSKSTSIEKVKESKSPLPKSEPKAVIYELKRDPEHPPGKGKSTISGNVVSGWI